MAPGYGTASVAVATTPAAISTFFTHIASFPQRHIRSGKFISFGGQQLRYEEGLNIVKSFMAYASTHSVEDVQDFTAQPVPIPPWVRREVVTIPEDVIDRAAEILTKHLATYGTGTGDGIRLVGGDKWWRIRGRELQAEWIEMSKHFARRTTQTSVTSTDKRKSFGHLLGIRPRSVRDDSGHDVEGDRVILYIHGGAFFFSSLDLHRYQIQRHARKAGARAFVPNYRLAPQYPFPCGLLDSLAAYLHLINPTDGSPPIAPSNIILMGDSAGGGMCLSLLILIREMGLPMPAAASLMSPWVDLTHSMPSIMADDSGDYIPNVGFHYRPSPTWPPIPGDGITVKNPDGEDIVVDDQIQLYCPNTLLTHPLVSPINAASLGGLCPLYINAGSAELLRDEVIYVAHKAADPTRYQPPPVLLEQYPDQAALVDKYPPTKVHLQVFEGACHVATTLAWTRSAKHIFRATANFNIWAFNAARKAAAAQESVFEPGSLRFLAKMHVPNAATGATSPSVTTSPSPGSASPMNAAASSGTSTPMTDESEPVSSDSEDEEGARDGLHVKVRGIGPVWGKRSIVAEDVSFSGRISQMEPDNKIPALDPTLAPHIGQVGPGGPLGRWLEKRAAWDERFGVQLKHWRVRLRNDRATAEETGFLTGTLQGETPPRSALVALSDRSLARQVGKSVDEPSTAPSTGVALWMKIGERADAEAMEGKHHRRSSWMKSAGRRASQVLERVSSRGSDKRKSWRKSTSGATSPSVTSPLTSPSLSRTMSRATGAAAVGTPRSPQIPAVDPVAAAFASLTAAGTESGASTPESYATASDGGGASVIAIASTANVPAILLTPESEQPVPLAHH